MLEAKEISYHYPNSPWLFRQLNFHMKPGEIVGLYGKSGSGKSTMSQIIAGYQKPLQGEVLIDGQENIFKGPSPVQLIWQQPEKAINPRWKMKKVLSEAGDIEPDIIQMLGIRKEWLSRFPSELSGGELQRFCIARALLPGTKYLIADEITTMLDAINQAQIWRIIFQLVKEKNIGVLAISHDPELLNRISDRIIDFEKLRK